MEDSPTPRVLTSKEFDLVYNLILAKRYASILELKGLHSYPVEYAAIVLTQVVLLLDSSKTPVFKIPASKFVRDFACVGLHEAKAIVDYLAERLTPVTQVPVTLEFQGNLLKGAAGLEVLSEAQRNNLKAFLSNPRDED